MRRRLSSPTFLLLTVSLVACGGLLDAGATDGESISASGEPATPVAADGAAPEREAPHHDAGGPQDAGLASDASISPDDAASDAGIADPPPLPPVAPDFDSDECSGPEPAPPAPWNDPGLDPGDGENLPVACPNQVKVKVRDPWGAPLAGAGFGYSCANKCETPYRRSTNEHGVAVLCDVATGQTTVGAHNEMAGKAATVNVTPDTPASVELQVVPHVGKASSLLDAQVTWVSADRHDVDVRFRIATSTTFRPCHSNYANESCDLPPIEVQACSAATDASKPRCISGTGADVWYTQVSPGPIPVAKPLTPRDPYSALLMLDLSRRASFDRWGTRAFGSRVFLERGLRPSDEIALAGFATSGGDPATPLQLPASPFWVPPQGPPTFTTDGIGRGAAVAPLVALTGGNGALYDALDAALDYVAAEVPSSRRRALIVQTVGDDPCALTKAERKARWSALAQKRSELGVDVVLVADTFDPDSLRRRHLRDLAATGFASLVLMPTTGDDGWGHTRSAALDHAASLLAGTANTYEVTLRLRAATVGGFASGAHLNGNLRIWDGSVTGGWWDSWVTKPFTTIIP